jgi:hypothetical protein
MQNPPFSEAVSNLGYDTETQEMLVRWSDGKVSAYAGVQPEKFDEISRAPSVGSAIHSEIKGKHQHRYR